MSGMFEEIIVSTDDKDIAEIARQYGVTVHERSIENANDTASTFSVIEEVSRMHPSELICCLYPCAPLVTTRHLNLLHRLMMAGNFDSVFPMVEYSHPIQRALKLTGNKVEMVHPENMHERTQDLEPRYHDAGQFYWLRTKEILKKGKLMTDNTTGGVVDNLPDIDNETDWKLAELQHESNDHSRRAVA